MPTPQTPVSTAPMPSKHISPNANTSNPLFNCPHALKTYFGQCQHLKPPFQLPPCPKKTFHPPVPTPRTPFSTHPMPSKHISHNANTTPPLFNCPHALKHMSPSANTSNPRFNCPHALKAHFTQCQHLKPPFQLPPCPENVFHTVQTPQTPVSSPHALKTYFTQCKHLKPPFQLPPCPPNIFHTVPTPHTPFSTPPMPSKHISHTANTSNPRFNCPHALKTHFTQCQHLKPPFQLTPCPRNIFHPVPTPQTPVSTAPMPSKHISHSANTSNPLFNCPHALKTHFTHQCQHLKPPFQLTQCPQNTFHTVPTPPIPFSTHPVPSKHISPNANASNPLFNCPHALKTRFTHCQHLKPPFQLPPCPQNTFHTMPTPQTPVSTAPMPSKHISPNANTSNPLFNSPHALQTHFTQCKHLKPPFQLPPCPQNTFHPVPTPQTPFSTAPMTSKHISPNANTSNPLFNFPHAFKTYFGQCQHLKPPFKLPRYPQNTFHTMPTPQTPVSTAAMP